MLLLGPSGSGKSTLLNVLSGIVPNLIELPMKYDELDIDPNCYFSRPRYTILYAKSLRRISFRLRKSTSAKRRHG